MKRRSCMLMCASVVAKIGTNIFGFSFFVFFITTESTENAERKISEFNDSTRDLRVLCALCGGKNRGNF